MLSSPTSYHPRGESALIASQSIPNSGRSREPQECVGNSQPPGRDTRTSRGITRHSHTSRTNHGVRAFPVRALLFDKPPEANWKVPWHQDLSIAVRHKRDITGFGPWSNKAGVLHVQPRVNVLESMLTVRIHLDDCGKQNGALRVIPGSHTRGRLTDTEIRKAIETPEVC